MPDAAQDGIGLAERWDEKVDGVFSKYATGRPSDQNAVDALPGWSSAFPPELGLRAGDIDLFQDPRLLWAMARFGPLEGRRVLELGPLEGAHSYMLERAGAEVVAVEANRLAYLKCLVVKEITGLRSARFRLGDFNVALEEEETRYDLVVASGVLYHMRDPLRLLSAIARRTDAVYLWTHFVPEAGRAPTRTETLAGVAVRLYGERYRGAHLLNRFCGGPENDSSWIHRDDLLAVLAALGFDRQEIAFEAAGASPSFSVFARRSAAAGAAP